MARVTVEDAVDQIGNRFDLVLVASKRARQIATYGKQPKVEAGQDKATVIALREIEQGLVTALSIEEEELAERREEEQKGRDYSAVANILDNEL